MSAASDKFEKDVAYNINAIPGIKAERPTVGTQYSDVRINYGGKSSWLEVKMNHTDNLSNPRVFYKGARWQTTYTTPAAKTAVQLLNRSPETKKFITAIAKFAGIPVNKVEIPTTKGGLSSPYAVPLSVMKEYFNQPGINRYIAMSENFDMGKLVTEHYTVGKAEPAFYMQAADDFYRISNRDPFKLGGKIPLLKGKGDFKVRVATRSAFYEVQAEIKIISMPNSNFSLAPGSAKKNPFLKG
jgi:hypothetical protein